MFGWLRRRRLSDESRRRLLISLARAEEALVETHVQNVLDVVDSVGSDLPLDRLLDLYLESMEPTEPRASIIARRALARLESLDGGTQERRPPRRVRIRVDD